MPFAMLGSWFRLVFTATPRVYMYYVCVCVKDSLASKLCTS